MKRQNKRNIKKNRKRIKNRNQISKPINEKTQRKKIETLFGGSYSDELKQNNNELNINKMENKENKSWNLQGLTDVTSLDELFEFRGLIEEKLDDMIDGGSIEGNGFNLSVTYNEKPWLLRVEIDEFHLKMWKQMEEK